MDNGASVTYDPRRLRGVNVHQEALREFATGDRIQFTASDKDLGIANRSLGTITHMEPGEISVGLDGKEQRTVTFDPQEMRHLEHGYVVTSHSSQGLTADRVLANIDTDSARSLINTRLAYVAISRASEDARIYTNNAETLGERLAHDVSKTAAVEFRQPCTSSNGSPQPNCWFALHRSQTGSPHEPTTSAPNPLGASASPLHLRLARHGNAEFSAQYRIKRSDEAHRRPSTPRP